MSISVSVSLDSKTEIISGNGGPLTGDPLVWVTIDKNVHLFFRTVEEIERIVKHLQEVGNWMAEALGDAVPIGKEAATSLPKTAVIAQEPPSAAEPAGTFPHERCFTDGCDGKPEERSMYCPECVKELLKQIPF